jgi:hypothetical protein
MLSPIPRRILRDTATFSVPSGFDRYQNPLAPTVYTVANVHIQADNSTHKTAQNTEVTLRGILFVDARYSTPTLDYEALQEATQKLGGVMTVTVADRHGGMIGPFTVVVVDALPDDESNLHHWELGLV